MVFFYLVLILHFCCFQSFKELVSVFVETDCKVTTFFWICKIFQKKYSFFFSNVCFLNSQATSLDCGCKVTAFSETTKIFLCFFWKFFVTRYILRRKILILSHFLCFSCRFLCLFPSFFTPKKHAEEHNFSRFWIFLCFFNNNE